ncbi:hypothetical protein RSOLAG22IIIB_09597 [Rhizoctonia solani]|uniref:Kex protein n=1 Tax=Rhizoctonia solani TaxID=456999 RepID=A0A0K6FZC2_9AGAM|nr:hypothetical protein RSOLAG22IIIB_09597 [Rhizoctonia solani]
MTSADCEGRASPNHTIGILMERYRGANMNITVTGLNDYAWDQPVLDSQVANYGDSRSCSRLLFAPPGGGSSTQPLELWTCNQPKFIPNSGSVKPDAFLDGIHIGIESFLAALAPNQTPLIWLFNLAELPPGQNLSSLIDVRTYLPPWRLRRGFHIEAEAKLITRRFITSSILKDIILNAQPVYRPLSLYPIVESSVNGLNSTDYIPGTILSSYASATLRATLSPGIMYFRDQNGQRYLDTTTRSESCDFIEDYRSGTILDVVGSVGGLFALLHAAHVLLFGRPLFWGLTGAKLITPFGLLGACTSRAFRRRLRDQYHTRSLDGGPDTIRVDTFLRDFVIDFGPADIGREQSTQQPTVFSPKVAAIEESPDGVQIPLMHEEFNETGLEEDNTETSINHNSDRANDVV